MHRAFINNSKLALGPAPGFYRNSGDLKWGVEGEIRLHPHTLHHKLSDGIAADDFQMLLILKNKVIDSN